MVFEVNNVSSMHQAIDGLCRYLQQQGASPDMVFDGKLVASELLGNVLRHTQGGAKIKGEIQDGYFHLYIFSDVAYYPPAASKNADVYAEHGRGLFLVDSVCAERNTLEEGAIVVKLKMK